MVSKFCFLAFLVYLMGVAAPTYGQHIQVYYGHAVLTLPINSDVYIGVSVYSSSQNVWIGSLHIPLATDNRYITTRYIDNTQFFDSLAQWDDVSFLNPDYNTPRSGWTSQSILGWADLGGGRNPYLHPIYGPRIANYKMRTANDTTLIGQTRTVFDAGSNPVSGLISFSDTLGSQNYTDIGQSFYQVTFCACVDSDKVGTGIGVTGNQQNHIDTYCNTGLNFLLKDITRRLHYNPHGHNGQMRDTASVYTLKYGVGGMTDIDNIWNAANQASGIDAHVYAGKVYDFLLGNLGRNGYDSTGRSMVSIVENPLYQNNAVYDSSNEFVSYGTVSADRRSFAGWLDNVGHEWGHGVTHHCSNLGHAGEPGALGEAFSDMLGATANKVVLNNQQWWILGDGVFTNGCMIGNMQTPTQQQCGQYRPDTYLGQYWQTDSSDNYGVHTNCYVADKMFYLLAAGGTHNGINVQSIGIENAFKVMYETNRRRLWPSNATFWNARDGCIRGALQIDASTHWARSVADAWNAVNLCDTCQYVPGDFNGNGEARGSDITRLVSFLKGDVPPPPDSCHVPYQVSGRDWFYVTGDYNGDCQVNGADVSWGVAYYKLQKPEIRHCPHFSPSAP
jgi:hypothetical protein